MAFTLSVVGYLKDGPNEPAVNLSPAWWDKHALMGDPRFKESLSAGAYIDHDAYLSVDEMIELHEQFLPKATSGLYSDPGWQKIVQRELTQLRHALFLRGDEFDGFQVSVNEWESGLG